MGSTEENNHELPLYLIKNPGRKFEIKVVYNKDSSSLKLSNVDMTKRLKVVNGKSINAL